MSDFELALKLAELYEAADKSPGTPDGASAEDLELIDCVIENFQQIIDALQRS